MFINFKLILLLIKQTIELILLVPTMSKESILNYQVQMIDYKSDGLSKPNTSLNYQFTLWELNQKIQEVIGSSKCTLRWIGNCQSSYLYAFVYILFQISLKKQDLILKLKQNLYELSKKYLEKSHQKLLVQFLCLIQYTKDKYTFLRKYPEVTKIIVSILKFYENQMLDKQNLKTSIFSLDSPIKNLAKQSFGIYCKKFNYIRVSHPNQYTYKFKNEEYVIHLVVEKDCYFVIQKDKNQQTFNKYQTCYKNDCQFKNSTPRFQNIKTTLNKQKQSVLKNRINYNKQEQSFLENCINNQSNDCSIQQIHNTLKLLKEETSVPLKKLTYDQLQTQKYLSQTTLEERVNKRRNKKSNVNEEKMIQKMRNSQQKRKQLWFRLQQQYYEKKRQIQMKKKQKQKKKHKNSFSFSKIEKKGYMMKSQKQRKTSFNSFSAFSMKDNHDSDYFQSQFDKKSAQKYHECEMQNKWDPLKSKKNYLKESPIYSKQMLRKKSSNQNISNQENRLSVIQEEKRLKFLNFGNKSNSQLKSPKQTSKNTSNRQTLQANVFVKFNYINKNPNNYYINSTPKLVFCRQEFYGSPIRV